MTGAVPRDRRRFLTAGAAVLGAAASAQLWLPGSARAAEPPLPDGVFTLGVASGDWYYDAWDGYQAERNALMEEFASIRNPMVLTGDRHLTMISDLKRDFADPESDVVGAEFVGTSISTGGDQDQAAFHTEWDPRRPDNPHWKFIDAHRGYHLFDIRRDGIDAQVRTPETVLRPEAASSTLARLRVEAGEPGVRLV